MGDVSDLQLNVGPPNNTAHCSLDCPVKHVSSPLYEVHYRQAECTVDPSANLATQFATTVRLTSGDLTDVKVAVGVMAEDKEAVGFQRVSVSISAKPPMPIQLKFVDVVYKVAVGQPKRKIWGGRGGEDGGEDKLFKEIVRGMTGSVSPGEMLAMMGPSGSGKTTLLNVLGSRVANPHNVSGVVRYNGRPYHPKLKRRMVFVTQDDVLFPHLTVQETLMFSALLRLPKWMSKASKMDRVNEVVSELGLTGCSDTIIGTQLLRGVSGGERKRVCVAQEILTDPSILFLDEPTSGLDSTTALRLVQLLQAFAHHGRTVVITIHQPSSRVFHMFDKLILLSEGCPLYFGAAQAAMTYLDSVGFSPSIPANPADFLLDLCSGINPNISNHHSHQYNDISNYQSGECTHPHDLDYAKPSSMATRSKLVLTNDVKQYLVECYESRIYIIEKTKLLEMEEAQVRISDKDDACNPVDDLPSWWNQFMILMARGMKERRHEYLSLMRVIQVVGSAFLAGCLWWQSKHSTLQKLQDQVGLLFFIAVFWGYLPLFTAIFTFPVERAVLSKERASNMYQLSAYFMARTLGDVPLDLALPLIFMIIIYFMANLQPTAPAFFLTLLTVFLTVITSQGFGLLIGAVMMDVQKATTFASIAVLGFMLGGGFFVQHIPPFVSWIKFLSFQAHTFKILMVVQYAHTDGLYDCSNTGCQSIDMSPALRGTSLHGETQSLVAMLVMVFAYRILAYIALRSTRVAA